MAMGFVAFLILAVLPPPLPVLILLLVGGWFVLREIVDGLAELFGADAGRAQRRHDERMTRMRHQHERWRADREARLGDPHPTIGRAVQGRIARWIEQSGTRIGRTENLAEAEREADREPSGWRAALRRAKQATLACFRGWAQQAERRLDTRPRSAEPVAEPAESAADPDGGVAITTDDAAPAQRTAAVPAEPDPGPEPDAVGEQAQPESVPTAAPPPTARTMPAAPSPGAATTTPTADPAASPGPETPHFTRLSSVDSQLPVSGVITRSRHGECPMPVGRPIDVDEDAGRVEYRACGKPLAEGRRDCGGEHHAEPPRPQNATASHNRAPHLALVRNTPTEGDTPMTDSLNLASGQTINPETGLQFATSVSEVCAEMAQRTHNSVAALQTANVDPAQIADLTELANLVTAAQAKADAMADAFRSHQQARGAVESTGAGTDNNYLGRH